MKSCPGPLAIMVVIAAALALAGVPAHAQDTSAFEVCIDALRRELPRHPEVRAETFAMHTHDVQDLRPVIRAASDNQPEFKLPIWDYIARLVDAQRIADGKEVLAAQSKALQAITLRRGVDGATVVAVFGVETDYGKVEGRHRVIDATLSRACLDLTSKERKRHFFAALWLLQEGLVQRDAFRGSWAGAFGLTQFMPGTFVTYMEAGDGSGTADIIGSAPDALATTANFVAGSGWVTGLRWGIEVTQPRGAARAWVAAEREHACLATNPADKEGGGKCRTVDQWRALGITVTQGQAPATPGLPGATRVALLAPGGDDGPAWLVTRNYQAIWQYNRADAYALAIGLLSDALRGDPPMRAAWATDDPGLSRAELRALQTEFIQRGHTEVVADGFDGPRTREAIRAEERLLGWPETGRAGARIARSLKDLRPP